MKNKFFVYILECRDNSYYTGIAKDLLKRMKEHQEGKGSKYVRAKGFKKLVYSEIHEDESSARKRECQIKKLKRKYKENIAKAA